MNSTLVGIFSDGSGSSNYPNNAQCSWLITANGQISVSFSSFNTESGWDFVTINQCAYSDCSSPMQLARLSGTGVDSSTAYTSSSGLMQVVFASDSIINRAGFEAVWTSVHAPECTLCQPGSYAEGFESSECTRCPGGTFQDEAGASSCKACPFNSSSSSGSSFCLLPSMCL